MKILVKTAQNMWTVLSQAGFMFVITVVVMLSAITILMLPAYLVLVLGGYPRAMFDDYVLNTVDMSGWWFALAYLVDLFIVSFIYTALKEKGWL